jgi:hypothetical protein
LQIGDWRVRPSIDDWRLPIELTIDDLCFGACGVRPSSRAEGPALKPDTTYASPAKAGHYVRKSG